LFKPRQRDQDVGRLRITRLGGAPLPLHHERFPTPAREEEEEEEKDDNNSISISIIESNH